MDQIGNLLDRPKAYYNVDGLGELGIGFFCALLALLGWLQVHSPKNSFWNRMDTLNVFFGAIALLIHFGTKEIKKRVTYPRTGYVQYGRRDTIWKPLIIAFGVALPVSLIAGIGIRRHWELGTPASLVGLILAASYAHGIARTVRWKWAVAWAMAAGSVLIAMLPGDLIGSLAAGSWITAQVSAKTVGAFLLSFLLYGALLLISGGVSFWLYLRHTEPPAAEGQ